MHAPSKIAERFPALLIALMTAVAASGCAGSATPLPDLAELPPRILSSNEREAAVVALESRRVAVDDVARQIEQERNERDRVK